MHAHIPNPRFMVMAETSTSGIFRGRNVHGRNVQAETSVAEMSVAEMSEHHVTYVSAGFDKVLLALVLGCYGLVQRGTGGPDHSPSEKLQKFRVSKQC